MKQKRKLIAIIPTSKKTSEQITQDVHKVLKKKMPKLYEQKIDKKVKHTQVDKKNE